MSVVLGWLMFLASLAGHTEWWIIAVNRSHALPIQATKLRKFRTLHDVAVVGYPSSCFHSRDLALTVFSAARASQINLRLCVGC